MSSFCNRPQFDCVVVEVDPLDSLERSVLQEPLLVIEECEWHGESPHSRVEENTIDRWEIGEQNDGEQNYDARHIIL